MAGLYVHIPFCASRCGYCDFFSTTQAALAGPFVEALCRELEDERGFPGDKSLETIYFGGGTPSTLGADELAGIFRAIERLWDTSAVTEITIEANPDDMSPAWLAGLHEKTPVNRLSIGIQSFDDGILKLMNRRHNAAGAMKAIGDARAAGFENISADLIYGVPGLTDKMWRHSIETLLGLAPEHISAYHLTIEPGTPFHRRGMKPVEEEQGEGQYHQLRETLARAGYNHYEISNFARPGRQARHNSAYWRGETYLGVGPAAHSYDGEGRRRWSAPNLENYIKNGPVYQEETLSEEEKYNEYIMVSLRTAQGIDPAELAGRFGAARLENFTTAAANCLATGNLIKKQGRYAIPPEKFLISDAIIAALFA